MTEERPREAWTRCPACSTVMPNIGIARQGHKLNCPHDMQLKIQRLEDRVKELEDQLDGEPVAEEPVVDFDGVADWDDDEDQEPAAAAPTEAEPLHSDGWDDEPVAQQSYQVAGLPIR